MLRHILLLIVVLTYNIAFAQPADLRRAKDSTLKAMYHADSMKVEKDFAEQAGMAEMMAQLKYPVIKAGDFSGVFPVDAPTEVPDPNMDYKILFELTANNPDSLSGELNESLTEICRVINLHAASGIPLKRIFPVIVVHGPGLAAFTNNQFYQEHYKKDNPNIKVLADLEKLGAKFIACGQAMAFFNYKKTDMLPQVRISLTAQTVLTGYQLKGYVWRKIVPEK